MYTTLNEILFYCPKGRCTNGESGFSKLLKNLNKTKPDNEPLHLMDILKSNGIEDAVWSLRCFNYLDYCLFLADALELATPVFEKVYPNDDGPRKAIQAIRDYKAGKITKEQLTDCVVGVDGRASTYVFCVADAINAALRASFYSYNTFHAVYDAQLAYGSISSSSGWDGIEQLFIKHFGGQS